MEHNHQKPVTLVHVFSMLFDAQTTDYFTLLKVDQLKDDDEVIINNPGLTENDFTDFEYGVDFFDGRLEEDHSRPHTNLQWDQYRWDSRSVFYYINDNGEFVVRVNKEYAYDPSQIVT